MAPEKAKVVAMTSGRDAEPHNAGDATQDPDRFLSRRTFLIRTLGVAGALGATGLVSPIVRYAYPVVAADVGLRQMVATTTDLGPQARTVDFDYQEVPCSIVLQDDGTYVGVSRVCTHLGCIIKWRPDEADFFCPCHAGIFSPTGEVLGGPPPRPLPHLRITQEGADLWAEGWLPG